MMTSSSYRETAKIYQFPAGGRAGLRIGNAYTTPIEKMEAVAATRTVVSGSWYHEEAIREIEPAGKR